MEQIRGVAYSVNKLAVALKVMDKVDKGQLKLDQKLTLTPDIIAPGSGIYFLQTWYGDNLTCQPDDCNALVSDNTAVADAQPGGIGHGD